MNRAILIDRQLKPGGLAQLGHLHILRSDPNCCRFDRNQIHAGALSPLAEHVDEGVQRANSVQECLTQALKALAKACLKTVRHPNLGLKIAHLMVELKKVALVLAPLRGHRLELEQVC